MTKVTVRIPTPLRPLAGGAGELQIPGATVGEALQQLDPALIERILTPEGQVRHFVNIYLGSRNVVALEGLATPVAESDIVSIVPAVSGGGARTLERRMEELRACIPEVTPPRGTGAAARRSGPGGVRLAESEGHHTQVRTR